MQRPRGSVGRFGGGRGALWGCFRGTLGELWDSAGPGLPWGTSGLFWSTLGVFWGHFGGAVGQQRPRGSVGHFGGVLGALWGSCGAAEAQGLCEALRGVVGHFGGVVGQYRPWGSVRHFGGVMGKFWGVLEHFAGAVGQRGPRGAMGRFGEPWGWAGWKQRGAGWALQGSVGQCGVGGRARGGHGSDTAGSITHGASGCGGASRAVLLGTGGVSIPHGPGVGRDEGLLAPALGGALRCH